MEFETESEIKGVWRVANVANDLLTSTVVGAFCLHIADDWFLKTALGVLLAFLWKRYFQTWTNDRIVQAHLAAAANQIITLNKVVAKYQDTITASTAQHKCKCNSSGCSSGKEDANAAAATGDAPSSVDSSSAVVDEKDADSPDEYTTPLLVEGLEDQVPRRALISLSLSYKLHVTGELWPVLERTRKLRASGAAGAGDVVNLIQGSRRILQTHVIVRSDLMENLKNVVIEAAKIDKDCTLQLDGCVVFKNTENGVQMLKLDDISVPTITHAESTAGVLSCIKGLHLEGAKLKATSRRRTVVLKVTGREKSPGGLEILSCMEPLPMRNLDEVFVYASKRVKVDGHYVDVVSAAASIQDVQLRTAIRDWIPAAIMIICVAKGMWVLARPSILNLNFNYAGCAWIVPGLAICLLQLLPSRAEEFIKQGVKSVARSTWSMYESLQSIKSESKLDVRRCLALPSGAPPPPKSKSRRSSATTPAAPAAPAPAAKPEVPAADAKPAVPEKPVSDPDWQWPSFDEYAEKSGPPKLKERTATPDANNSPFQVVYKRKPHQQWPDVVSINLSSPVLVRVVQKLLPSKKDLQYVDKPAVLGKELYLVLDQLVAYELTAEDVDPPEPVAGTGAGALMELETAQLHLAHLIRFMKKEYNDVTVRMERMRDERQAPWDMLWVFFPPGAKVAYNCKVSKEQLLAQVKSTNFNYNSFRKYSKFDVVLDVYDYNGQSYRKCNITKEIDEFEGEQELQKLDVCPLEFAEHSATLEATCLANGRKFCSLVMRQNFVYMHYRGPLVHYRKENGCWQLFSCNADGRVMIDLASFAKMNPNYPMGNAQPLTGVLRGNQITTCDHMADANLVFAPAIVYGFSFSQKQWGMFAVSGICDIVFNAGAFESLVMDGDEKQLMYNLVSQYLAPPPPAAAAPAPAHIDPISNKGEGCIFLCYGPPGTGKTLTAESIAEELKRPLWALSVSELGTSAAMLEATLVKVLDIAASWRAVLLLDEADVYLESRKASDVFRNAMTGVFLRLLEYYRGVLFLTTNRVTTFDEAFLSRISMFLNYKKLETHPRELVWKKLLTRAQVPGVTDEFVAEAAEEDLNGRSIRNIIQTAQTWAKSRGEDFSADHVKSVLKVTAASLDVLRNCMGHVSDLSYFM
ncbi:hypothetical protein MPTK1_6g08350 [Marchantia polymorpha subsp. ruderalis]|uniref:AAA+ ATPase domain-containing protein n=4 Tax=Marchantia polymorpha TaxID=3197 RepID=A0AAF6BPV1_MARPO|nr:hypothetical protein MARPO_0060s0086 [Marchantia polymorpha]BBN14035.1 hypothetical protein Mp_6g08350 [Marchantia polymorpha subsp. ruderalis]|eukprot:PTQ37010.1 hypothetical protein MARPO_0060s0086 [Marchantia polymorpha]